MDPILALADFDRAADFKLAGKNGRVIPQHLEAGSTRHHTRFFYVEYPSHGGPIYQISMSKLASMLADGAADRSLNARDSAAIIAAIPRAFDPEKVLRAISI
jgi:hypothetical protein